MSSQDDKEQTIATAHRAADIDGYGDEGAGYDYAVFARELEARGWTWREPVDLPVMAERSKECIGCRQLRGDPHKVWCPVLTGTLGSLR